MTFSYQLLLFKKFLPLELKWTSLSLSLSHTNGLHASGICATPGLPRHEEGERVWARAREKQSCRPQRASILETPACFGPACWEEAAGPGAGDGRPGLTVHRPGVRPWASHPTAASLSFHICQRRLVPCRPPVPGTSSCCAVLPSSQHSSQLTCPPGTGISVRSPPSRAGTTSALSLYHPQVLD